MTAKVRADVTLRERLFALNATFVCCCEVKFKGTTGSFAKRLPKVGAHGWEGKYARN